MAQKLDYLNVGCGSKVHPAWVNIDMVSSSPEVITANLLEGFPFPDARFAVVYHSQVLEHFPKDRALPFIRECHRVLRPGGLLRVVVPDLGDIVREYLRWLDACAQQPTEQARANHEWMTIELLDQMVRDRSGGAMGEYLARPVIANEDFVLERIGSSGRKFRENLLAKAGRAAQGPRPVAASWRRALRDRVVRMLGVTPPDPEVVRVGRFRRGGEVHLWMYDRFSLGNLLREAGFTDITLRDPYSSAVPDWSSFGLDVKDGAPYDPTSLFMEARKP